MRATATFRTLLIALTLAAIFHTLPARAAECESGSLTDKCLAQVAEKIISNVPAEKEFSDNKRRQIKLIDLLAVHYRRMGDDDRAEKLLTKSYDEKAEAFGKNHSNKYIKTDRDPANEFARLLANEGMVKASDYKNSLNGIVNHANKPVFSFPADCEKTYIALLSLDHQKPRADFKAAKLCPDAQIAELDMLLAFRHAEFSQAFTLAVEYGLAEKFSSAMRTMTYYHDNVLLDGRIMEDEGFKHKKLIEALPILTEKGENAGTSYMKDFALAFLRYDDIKNADAIIAQASVLENDVKLLHARIGAYLAADNHEAAVVMMKKINATPLENRKITKGRGLWGALIADKQPLLGGYFDMLFGNIGDREFIRLALDGAKTETGLLADVAAIMAKARGTEYLNSQAPDGCGTKASVFSQTLYECLSSIAMTDIEKAQLNAAFGRFEDAAAFVPPATKSKEMSSDSAISPIEQGKFRSDIQKILALSLDLSECNLEKVRPAYQPVLDPLSALINRSPDINDEQAWLQLQSVCMAKRGRIASFLDKLPETDRAFAAVSMEDYLGRPNAVYYGEGRYKSSFSRTAALELIPYLADERKKLFLYGRASYMAPNENDEEKKLALKLIKNALQHFTQEEQRQEAEGIYFSWLLKTDMGNALQRWENDASLRRNVHAARTLKDFFITEGMEDRAMEAFYAMPLELRRERFMDFFSENHLKNKGGEYIHINIEDLPADPEKRWEAVNFLLEQKQYKPPILGPFRGVAITF